jgi:predicted nucleic acid-binding protein
MAMGKKAKAAKAKRRRFVLDCSITMAWAFEDEADAYADAVADGFHEAQAVVPRLWPLEVANVLLVGERRKRITEVQVAEFLALLDTLAVVVDHETAAHAWQETLRLARTHALSVYDAAYLELAVRRRLPLASLDDKLKATANAIGVPPFEA